MSNDDILDKLDKIIELLSMQAIQGKEKNDQIKILNSLGFKSKLISDLTGIPNGTVRRIKSTKLKKNKQNE